jgi:hypothetical protein
MDFFFENPWRIVSIGIAVEAVLTFLLFQTGRGKILWAMIAVALLTAAGVIVERLVVTDREAVENTLDAAVDAVKADNEKQLLACIAPSAKSPQEDAAWVLKRVTVEEAYLSGLKITVNRSTNPPTAEAKFLAVGSATLKGGLVAHERYATHVTVRLRQEGGRWLVVDYAIEDVPGPLRKMSLQ